MTTQNTSQHIAKKTGKKTTMLECNVKKKCGAISAMYVWTFSMPLLACLVQHWRLSPINPSTWIHRSLYIRIFLHCMGISKKKLTHIGHQVHTLTQTRTLRHTRTHMHMYIIVLCSLMAAAVTTHHLAHVCSRCNPNPIRSLVFLSSDQGNGHSQKKWYKILIERSFLN